MSGIVPTILCALIVVLASVVVGRTAMLALGWRRPEWLAGGVGLALLVTLAPFLIRLPGRGLTAAILLAILAPIVARLVQLAVSRQREYLADASSVELTRNPRPPDYAATFARQAATRSGLDTAIAVVGVNRPPWLEAVVAEPGVIECALPVALALFDQPG